METRILKGNIVASKIKEDISRKITKLKSKNIIPSLAVIIIGNDLASKLYVNSKAKAFKKLNCYSKIFELPENVKKSDLIELINSLNENEDFHGLLLQLRLHKHLPEREVLEKIDPKKDVDGFHPENQGYLMQGNPRFVPCTPLGCLKILEYYEIDSNGKHVVVIGRSNIVGKPMYALLSQNFDFGNSTVTMCHTKTRDLNLFTKEKKL